MPKTTSGNFITTKGSIYYETAGEGQSLVLSHAAFLDSRMFDGIWDRLVEKYRVMRYDMIGYGQSSPAREPLCRRANLYELLSHLGIQQTHFIGSSNGGEIVLDLALEYPDLAQSVTVVNGTPSGFQMQGEPPRYMIEMFEAEQRGDVDRVNDLQIRILFDGMYREPDQVDSALRAKALMMNRIPAERNTSLIADKQPANPLTPSAVTRLRDVQCPTLVVVGSLDHPETIRAASVIAREVPNVRKVVMEGCAHVPSYEQPDAFLEIVLKFLQEL